MNIANFYEVSSGTGGYSFWLGLYDNINSCGTGTQACFYQAGLAWFNPNYSCDYWQGWAVDDYNGQSLGIAPCTHSGNEWAATSFTSGTETVGIFLYSGQWYYYFSGSPESGYAPSGAQAFPGGADSASHVSGKLYGLTEGGNSTYNYGGDVGLTYQYVSAVSLSGNTFTLTVVNPSSGNFYETTSQSHGAPPSTANWSVTTTCPYYYTSDFLTYTGSLPSNGASVSMC